MIKIISHEGELQPHSQVITSLNEGFTMTFTQTNISLYKYMSMT